jgi:hypothetical protein
LPDLWLSSLIGKRKKVITRALPDALDLLTISVEAGLGFDAALNKVAQKWDNALSEEFNRTFYVTSEDRRFANAFLDAQMIDLLAATKGFVEMEVKNRWILLYTERLKGNELPPLYKLTETIVARIPRLVYEMWPAQ